MAAGAHTRNPSLPSLDALIIRKADLGFQNKGAVCFLSGFFTPGLFLRVRVCRPLMQNTPTFASATRLAEQPEQNRTGRREDGRGKRRGKAFFPFQSALGSWLF